MQVLLDATAGARSDPSGIGRYVHELILGLSRLDVDLGLTLGVRWKKRQGRERLPQVEVGGRVCRVRLLEDRLDRWFLRGYDLVHGLDARLCGGRHQPRIATLHDVFALEHEDLAATRFRSKKLRRYRDLADHAARVLCVSAVTRDRFVAAFPQAAERCRVVHHGVSDRFVRASTEERARVRGEYGLVGRFLLFVGLLSIRKNVVELIEAFEEIAEEQPDLQLVLAGSRSHGIEEIDRRLARSPVRQRVLTPGFVPSDDLPALYTSASAFVFPTRDEGFGLPVLEALACGTAVVASDLEVLREVGGHFPEWCEPGSARDLARALRAALATGSDPAEEKRRQDWAAQFHWNETARKTWEAYQELVPGP